MIDTRKFSLNIMVALHCEAKPIIDFYRLSKLRNKSFDSYCGSTQTPDGKEYLINLVVTGIGSLNMSVACGWLAASTQQYVTIWLNIGTAGHKDFEIGKIVRVHRAVEISSGKSHYPAMTAKWPEATSVLISYDSECTNYPEATLVDMEGTVFFRSACMFASTERVQSLKIVSDNEDYGVERLNAALISELIVPHVDLIHRFSSNLINLLVPTVDLDFYLSQITHLHCTASQRQQYSSVLMKLFALDSLDHEVNEYIKSADSLLKLLGYLNQRVEQVEPGLRVFSDRHG